MCYLYNVEVTVTFIVSHDYVELCCDNYNDTSYGLHLLTIIGTPAYARETVLSRLWLSL